MFKQDRRVNLSLKWLPASQKKKFEQVFDYAQNEDDVMYQVLLQSKLNSLHTTLFFICFVRQVGRSNDLQIDIMLHFIKNVCTVPGEPGIRGGAVRAIESSVSDYESDEHSIRSKKCSRFAGRIVIHKATQKAYLYAGAFDKNMDLKIGVRSTTTK